MKSREDSSWSVPIARLCGVQLRIHVFFFLFTLWTLYIAWHSEQLPGNQGNLLAMAALCLGILGASVLLQEIARLLLLKRFGGRATALVLGPYGGMSHLDDVPRPRDEMLVHLAAPAVSAAVTVIASLVLMGTGDWNTQLLHPTRPEAVAEGSLAIAAVKIGLWTNALLVLLHVIPAFPFHGGRVLRAAILWRAPHLGRREASRAVVRLARLIACFMVLAALILLRESPAITTWSALLLLAVLVFLSAEHEQGVAVELPSGHPTIAPAVAVQDSVVPARSTKRIAAERAHSPEPAVHPEEVEIDAEAAHADSARSTRFDRDCGELTPAAALTDGDDVQELQVDEVLMRVHECGLNSLSDSDRAILERASQRYRRKIGSQS